MASTLTWDSIAQNYLPTIRASVKDLGCPSACADDVVQDILIRLNTLLQEGRLNGEIITLHKVIRKITSTFVKNRLRKISRESVLGSVTEDGDFNPSDRNEKQELDHSCANIETLIGLIDKLPEELQDVVNMRRHGLSHLDISAVLGININVISKCEVRATNMMRRAGASDCWLIDLTGLFS